MSDLDDKLHKLPLATVVKENGSIWLSNKDIAQIKQAFADAGYAQTNVREKADELLQGMVNMHANMKQDMIRLGLTSTPKKPKSKLYKDVETMARDHGYMTGQEWYERFEKELYKPPKQELPISSDDGESHDRFFRAGGANFMYARALEAAKRASGLE